MPRIDLAVSSPITATPRTVQLSAMFDLPPMQSTEKVWRCDVPFEARDWNIGLIVGPSGCGKSVAARHLFAKDLVEGFAWPADRSVIDTFPAGLGIQEICGLLGAVGFNTPPSWLKPFAVLSNGEQFRVTIARALAEAQAKSDPLLVIDEFTSVVDRQVAQITSHCVGKAVRARGMKFVAVTCHYDVLEWLQPDWVYQPAVETFTWRSLQRRPSLELEVYPISRSAWSMFKHHHYLSGDIHVGAQCFGGFIHGECVAFTSFIHFPHPRVKDVKHGHRLVVLPDYQGLGIGGRMDDWLGHHLWKAGYRYVNVVAHPAMVAYYQRSPRWKCMRKREICGRVATTKHKSLKARHLRGHLRQTSSFVYVPRKEEP